MCMCACMHASRKSSLSTSTSARGWDSSGFVWMRVGRAALGLAAWRLMRTCMCMCTCTYMPPRRMLSEARPGWRPCGWETSAHSQWACRRWRAARRRYVAQRAHHRRRPPRQHAGRSWSLGLRITLALILNLTAHNANVPVEGRLPTYLLTYLLTYHANVPVEGRELTYLLTYLLFHLPRQRAGRRPLTYLLTYSLTTPTCR